jgi:regulator of CtrA degradation
LLTQRAVAEGDMAPSEAAEQRYRLSPSKLKTGVWPADDDQCPPRLADLVVRANGVHERLSRIDQSLFEEDQERERDPVNPVASQMDTLSKAFSN